MPYKFKVTINSAQVSGASHSNFPYLFTEATTGIPSGFWSHVSNPTTGADIKFFDTTETIQLKSEVVLFSSSENKVEAWVQIPTLVNSANTEIWCYYGGSTKANDGSMWNDFGARGVYHHQTETDSTSNGNTPILTNVTTGSVGKLNSAYSFNGASSYWTSTGLGASSASDQQGTISAWVYRNNDSAQDAIISIHNATNYNVHHLYFQIRNDRYAGFTHRISVTADNTTLRQARGNTLLSNSTWTHVALTSDGSTYRLYVNGVLQTLYFDWGSNDGRWVGDVPSANRAVAGYARANAVNLYMDGRLDELRVLGTVLSNDWILTEIANQNAPATFSSAGSEVYAALQVTECRNIIWIPGI
jgi:hypothetical protein